MFKPLLFALAALQWSHLIKVSDGASCTFPDGFEGTWYTTHWGTLNISYPYLSNVTEGTYGSLIFDCYLNTSNKFVIRSQSVTLINNIKADIFMCLDLDKQDANKYIINIATLPGSNSQRVVVKAEGSSATSGEVCNKKTAYDQGSHILMVKTSAVDSSKIPCPSPFNGTFSYVYTEGGSTYCTASSRMDICLDDTGNMAYDYASCPTRVASSAGGLLSCMYNVTENGVDYLQVINRDSMVNDTTGSYRFSCFAYSMSGNNILASIHPMTCASGQTSTSVAAPGATIQYTKFSTCISTSNGTGIQNVNPGTTLYPGTTMNGSLTTAGSGAVPIHSVFIHAWLCWAVVIVLLLRSCTL